MVRVLNKIEPNGMSSRGSFQKNCFLKPKLIEVSAKKKNNFKAVKNPQWRFSRETAFATFLMNPMADIENILKKQFLHQVELEPCILVERNTSILETVQKMRNTPKIHAAIVIEAEKPIGMLTQRNIMHQLTLSGMDLNESIESVMTPHPKTLTLQSTLRETVDLLNRESLLTLPIVNADGKIVGVATARALIHHITAHFPATVYNLPPDPHRVSSSPDGA